MERLTQRDEYGNADIIALSDIMPELYAALSFHEANALTIALNRLAEYEETGLSPADIQPVKRGHWIKKHRHRGGYREVTGRKSMSYETHTIIIDERYEIDDLYCSECGKLNESAFTNFCPNCQADMRGDININDKSTREDSDA